MNPLRILILSDGRAGHFNLSEGIAAAIGRLGPTTITRLDVRRGRWPGPALAALTAAKLPAAAMLRCVYGLEPADLPACDVIVSAGAETLAANVWLARSQRALNLFYGSLRYFQPEDFSLVLTSYARNAGRPRHLLALKPSAMDPAGFPPRLIAARPTRLGLLIGGDAGTFTYQDSDWNELLALLPRAHAALGITWRVSNSRRTPHAIGDRLRAMANAPTSGIEQFVDVREQGAATLRDILTVVDAVACTEDSSSMISECIWARLPVVGVSPAHFHHTPDESDYRRWLASNGWSASLPIRALTPEILQDTLRQLTPLSDNPLATLAARLEEAIPGLRERRLSPSTKPPARP